MRMMMKKKSRELMCDLILREREEDTCSLKLEIWNGRY